MAVRVMLERFDIVQAMFHGFDCTPGIQGTPAQRLKCLAEAIEWILARQHEKRCAKPRMMPRRRRTAGFKMPCWLWAEPSPWPRPATSKGDPR
jgi:type I restriction enzyme R subunit